MATSKAEQMKQAVILLLGHISIANGYNNDIKSIGQQWRPVDQLDNRDIPGFYVTNEAEDGDLRKPQKFSSRCRVEEDFTIAVLGFVRVITPDDIPEVLSNYLLEDVKKALARDLTLDGLADGVIDWQIRRPQPWKNRGKNHQFQLSITYEALTEY